MKYYLLGLLFCMSANASTTGTILLTGTVPANTSITVTPVSGASNLDLTTSQTDLVVANITEKNNTATGYKVTISSSNGGVLKNGTLGSLTYTAKYNSTSFSLATASIVTNQTNQSSVMSTAKTLSISYTGQTSDTLMTGTYSDNLTLTIQAN